MERELRKRRIALISVLSNGTLVILKLAVGMVIGSVSVISEAIHSGVDLVASGIALYSVRTSGAPADREHPFGHGKIENISGTVEALLIFAAACWIIYEAVERLASPAPLEAPGWGVAVMLLSAVVNTAVSHKLFQIGRETDSIALIADGWHLRTDVYTSAGVMAGLAVIGLGGRFYPGFDLHWVDPAAALFVAFLIVKAAWDLTVQSARDLLDVSLPVSEEEWIRERIRERSPLVKGYHKLRTRKSGHFRFIEFHIKVDPAMSVDESHRITQLFSRDIRDRFPGATVTIHIEPCDRSCPDACLEGCLLPETERQAMRGDVNDTGRGSTA